MKPKFRHLLAAAALCGGLNHVASAQTAAPTFVAESLPRVPVAALPNDGIETRVIQIYNVPVNVMAYWLDAAHNVVLPQYQDVKPTWAIGRSDADIKAMLSHPREVQSVTAESAGNAIWIIGTPAGIQQIAEKVALLDKPLRQIEIEAQCIQISSADVKTLGIAFSKGEGTIETGMAGANIRDQIMALVAQGRAKIITAPRVTALSGHKASVTSLTETPVVFNPKDEKGTLVKQLKQSGLPGGQYLLYVNQTIGLITTPTINSNGTITLKMGPLRTIGISGLNLDVEDSIKNDVGSNRAITLKDLDGIPTQPFKVKDGQTAVLNGLNWNFSEMNFSDIAKNSTTNVIVLLSAHIVRRAEDDVQTIALKR